MLSLLNSPAGVRLIGQSMVSGTSLMRAILVTFVFGAAVFGTYSLYAVVAGIIMNVLISVFVEPATSISAPMDSARRHRYFSTLSYLFLILIAILCVPLYIFTNGLTQSFVKSTIINILGAALFILLFVSTGVVRAFVQAFSGRLLVVAFDSMQSAFSLVFLGIALACKDALAGFGASNLVLWSQITGLGSCLFVALAFATWKWGAASIDTSMLGIHLRRSAAVTCVTALRALQVNLPALWTQFLLGEAVFGMLRMYQTFANFVSLPANALRLLNMSSGARALHTGGTNALMTYVVRIASHLSFLALIISLLVLVGALVLPSTLRPSAEGFGYIFLFLLFNTLSVANSSLSSYFYASGRLVPLITRSALGAMLCMIISPSLLCWLGGIGAPISQLIIGLFVLTVTLTFLKQRDYDFAT